jgi:hypothetical protein
MTVAELRAALEGAPDDALVYVESGEFGVAFDADAVVVEAGQRERDDWFGAYVFTSAVDGPETAVVIS